MKLLTVLALFAPFRELLKRLKRKDLYKKLRRKRK
jgi:hypothetical protein